MAISHPQGETFVVAILFDRPAGAEGSGGFLVNPRPLVAVWQEGPGILAIARAPRAGPRRMPIRRRLQVIGVLYLAALSLPAISLNNDTTILGIQCLIQPHAWITVEWWANPILSLGCVLLTKRRFAESCWCSLLGGVAALNTFLDFGLSGIGPGCLFWLASIFALLPAGLAGDHGQKVKSPAILNES